MKKSISIFVMIVTIVFLNSTVFAQVYNGVEIPEGESAFADEVTFYTDDPAVGNNYDNPADALGAPDYNENTTLGQVSLGDNGSIVIKFTDNSLTTSGNSDNDLWIFEVGEVEPGDIEISEDGSNWISVGSIEGATSGVDIDAYIGSGVVLWENYSYVRITDSGAGVTTGQEFPGVDVDAVAAISSDPPAEYFPKADAGSDQLVAEGAAVTLNGTNSTPPITGSISSYAWTQLSGTSVVLSGSTTAVATFTAPNTAPESLGFQLTVTDSNNNTDTDTITINIAGDEQMPVAGISPSSQTVEEGVTVTLTSNSTDPDGTIQSYLWSQKSGTTVTLSSTAAASITFTSPNVGTSGDALEFELTVTDNDGLKNTASAIVNISDNNTAPTAEAGANQTVAKGVTVTLNGTGSSDPDTGDTITYRWKKLSGPDVTLSNPETASPTFTSPSSDENVALEFQLTVTDNGGLQGTDTVIINVTDSSNTPPDANAGVDQAVAAGATVTLNGTASTDAEDNAITSFFWRQLTGTSVTLSDPASSQPTFTAPAAGNESLEFELTVSDSEGLKDTDSCVIAVAPAAAGDGGGSDSDSCFINSMSWK